MIEEKNKSPFSLHLGGLGCKSVVLTVASRYSIISMLENNEKYKHSRVYTNELR